MPTPKNNNWLKWATIAISVFLGLIILMSISLPLIESEKIFSNILVDSYKPRKVVILEKSPVRLIFYGETTDTNTAKLIPLIKALDEVKFEKDYNMNPNLSINVDSRLVGDRNRKSGHILDFDSDKSKPPVIEYRGRKYEYMKNYPEGDRNE